MVSRFALRTLIVIVLSALASCSSRELVKPQSALDTSLSHYRRGLAELEAGDLLKAEAAFNRARGIDPKFAGSPVGLALVASRRGEYDLAEKELGRARDLDDKFAPAYTAQGRVLTARGVAEERELEDWLPRALAAFKKAVKLSGSDPSEALFYRAETYVLGQEYRMAEDDLRQLIAANRGPYVERANAKMALIQDLVRVAPGTLIGLKIAQVEQITRAELAILLLEELKLREIIEKRRPEVIDLSFPAPSAAPARNLRGSGADVEGHWARNWIDEIVRLKVDGIQVNSDGNFEPDALVDRASYAKVNAGLLKLITGDNTLETRYLGQPSNCPDVRADFWAFPSIQLSVERGIMKADKISGRFYPQKSVSGIEALDIIRDFQNALRQEF